MSMNCFKIPKINKAYLQAPNSVCSCENITLYKCMNEAIYTKKTFMAWRQCGQIKPYMVKLIIT